MNLLIAWIPILSICYELVADEFESRWEKFGSHRAFVQWTPGRSSESIVQEFEALRALRTSIWFTEEGKTHPDFAVAEELIRGDYCRAIDCVAFDYNKASSHYNGSLVNLGKRSFVAMMGPREQDLSHFFRLLLDRKVAALVRLTPSLEGNTSKCYPYWENRLADSFIHIPRGDGTPHPLPYFPYEGWLDNQPTSPERLLAFVQTIRDFWDPSSGPLAVHCTNGVGRTGTVLAAILLLDEIDRQLALGTPPQEVQVSVQEIVLSLSLQRYYSCGEPSQYENLYRLVELRLLDASL